jgi:hypothetical protein
MIEFAPRVWRSISEPATLASEADGEAHRSSTAAALARHWGGVGRT